LGLKEEALRSGWIVLAHCWMPNQIHALLQTPEPNLASAIQHWLTGTHRVSNLVRRADRRRQSSGWQKTVQEIDASLRLNTEHKAWPRRNPRPPLRLPPPCVRPRGGACGPGSELVRNGQQIPDIRASCEVMGEPRVSKPYDATVSLGDYFIHARDVAKLDFVIVSDHDFGNAAPWHMPKETWKLTQDKVDQYTADGKFVAIAGYEWRQPRTSLRRWDVPVRPRPAEHWGRTPEARRPPAKRSGRSALWASASSR